MDLVYATEPFPKTVTKTIFLAGPSPRGLAASHWRDEAITLLQARGFDGTVFLPIPRDHAFPASYVDQIDWEDEGLHRADVILFWVPRDLAALPGFTTNVEFGEWMRSGKVVFGAPVNAPKVRYLLAKAERRAIPMATSLGAVIDLALQRLGAGAERRDGECTVPLGIWNTSSFQSWYRSQRNAGNRLDGARVEWTFSYGPQHELLFLWALRANVYCAAEQRNKRNEFVLGRPDIASVLLFHPGPTLLDTTVVFVKEFRIPAATPDGFIHELPGGSSWDEQDMRHVARDEVREETGRNNIALRRFRKIDTRQMYGTLSANRAHLYTVLLRDDELDDLKRLRGRVFGLVEHGERTSIEIMTVRQLLRRKDVDWSTLGMVLAALLRHKMSPNDGNRRDHP